MDPMSRPSATSPGVPRKGSLAAHQGRSDRLPGGDPGGRLARRLGPQFAGDIGARSSTCSAPAASMPNRVERRSRPCVALDIVEGKSNVLAAHGDQPIERAAVEQVPAELARHAARNRPLPEPLGPSMAITGTWLIRLPEPEPRRPRRPGKSGNEVATFCTSRIAIGERARAPSTAKVIATRWSPRLATTPPETGPPWTRRPSGRRSTATPIGLQAVCHGRTGGRSLSREVRRRRSRPCHPRQRPPRQRGSASSSRAIGTSAGGTTIPRSLLGRTSMSARGSPPWVVSAHAAGCRRP